MRTQAPNVKCEWICFQDFRSAKKTLRITASEGVDFCRTNVQFDYNRKASVTDDIQTQHEKVRFQFYLKLSQVGIRSVCPDYYYTSFRSGKTERLRFRSKQVSGSSGQVYVNWFPSFTGVSMFQIKFSVYYIGKRKPVEIDSKTLMLKNRLWVFTLLKTKIIQEINPMTTIWAIYESWVGYECCMWEKSAEDVETLFLIFFCGCN